MGRKSHLPRNFRPCAPPQTATHHRHRVTFAPRLGVRSTRKQNICSSCTTMTDSTGAGGDYVNRGRRCEFPGCRAWAMREERLCRAHLPRHFAPPSDERHPSRERSEIERRVDAIVSRVASETGLERESLADEIGALRVVLARLLTEEEDATRLATSIPRVVDAVVRAVRAQRAISGEVAESLTGAVTQVLMDLGLGGDP